MKDIRHGFFSCCYKLFIVGTVNISFESNNCGKRAYIIREACSPVASSFTIYIINISTYFDNLPIFI
ncbi:hypothetical protein BpHYR1_046146 [Brachionus plicatilis]|uniref:Uncharacterized protein n=1 Tax=Brachionus plicatilis TaxID=10195 RepID=A0A3M7R2D5_BRAPC|nr:hypothetical protein BpHYR1_046146 [Brachionus plicatilis]